MPLKTWDTKVDWDAAYDIGAEPEGHPNTRPQARAHYNRSVIWPYVVNRWGKIVAYFNWPLDTSILIVGCGFGWAIEYLQSLGYTDVWGVDVSVWIQGSKIEADNDIDPVTGITVGDGQARSAVPTLIRAEDIKNAGQANKLLNETGHSSGFDVVVTESLLESFDDSEAQAIANAIRQRKVVSSTGTVIHVIAPIQIGNYPGYNWKSLADWKVLLPNDVVVASNGLKVLE